MLSCRLYLSVHRQIEDIKGCLGGGGGGNLRVWTTESSLT